MDTLETLVQNYALWMTSATPEGNDITSIPHIQQTASEL